jgi:hypothetical protein
LECCYYCCIVVVCLDLKNPSWSCILNRRSLRTNNNGLSNPNFLSELAW